MKNLFSYIQVLVLLVILPSNQAIYGQSFTKYVDPYIGTGGHGHSFLGVTAPFGAVQIGPNNFNKGWDWTSGYHYSDNVVTGFSHQHLNGTGCADGGSLQFMPYTGTVKSERGTQENPTSGYSSHYSHQNEKATPAYYQVFLEDTNVNVELTATNRVAFHRYIYPKSSGLDKRLIISLVDANGSATKAAYIEQKDQYTIRGYRFADGWAKNQQFYFTARFSQPVKLLIFADNKPVAGKSFKGVDVKGNFLLDPKTTELKVKVGISPVSMDNAEQNIEREISHWDFQRVVKQARAAWEKELSKINVKGKNPDDLKIFYTAIYHAFMQPNTFSDADGSIRGADKNVYTDPGFVNYTQLSLWDTYRAAHPFYTISQPERVPDFVNTMLAIYRQTGMLPVWHLYGSDTYEMIGIASVMVIADAIMKDFKGFDYNLAFDAMKNSMMSDYKDLKYLRATEYIPSDKAKESVAKGLEYAIADDAVARVARKLGKTQDAEYFGNRAKFYRHYWDPETEFFRGKRSDGTWNTPFNPYNSTHRNDDYCEGTAWQYIWLVPQDVPGLMRLFPSEKAFTSKLDSLFVVKGLEGDNSSPDISGLIGQYAHGNEPGHHTVYLYNYAGQQWKTAEKVRFILKNMYHNNPDGLQGNEDCGQMSSWYILSALGFYQVDPSGGAFLFGSPLFDEAKIQLPGNKVLKIKAVNNSDKNIYIQNVRLNGKNYTKSFISYADIMAGGDLVFVMGSEPSDFGSPEEDRPFSTK